MKYLKKFEDYNPMTPDSPIVNWMKDHNFTEIDISELKIKEGHLIITKLILDEKRGLLTDYYTIGEDKISTMRAIFWRKKAINKILDYLNNLSEEEIEMIRIKKEAKKFGL